MKVLYIGGFELPDRNAAAHRVVSIAKTLRYAGNEVEFIGVTRKAEEIGKTFCVDGFKFTSIAYPSGIRSWIKQIVEFIPLKTIEKSRPNIVILYNLYAFAQKRIINYCHKNNIKVIGDITEWYQAHGCSIREIIRRIDIRLRMKKYNCRLDGIIAISSFLRDYYKSKVPTVYIPPTVDYSDEKFGRDRMLEAHHPIRLIFTGSISTEKDSIGEIVQLVKDDRRFQLDIIGVDKIHFSKIFKTDAVEADTIVFHGRIEHKKAIAALKESDFQLVIRDMNLVTKAGFPTKFVESLSCGIPVIATPSSNICDYLINEVNGFVIDEKKSLKQCLDRIGNMTAKEILDMKKRAVDMTDFSFQNYANEINTLIAGNENSGIDK